MAHAAAMFAVEGEGCALSAICAVVDGDVILGVE
jgi:hypothetical protein